MDATRLRILLNNIRTEFLSLIKASVNFELTRIKMVYKYKKEIDRSRDTVTQKFPPYMSTAGKNLLHVSKITPK